MVSWVVVVDVFVVSEGIFWLDIWCFVMLVIVDFIVSEVCVDDVIGVGLVDLIVIGCGGKNGLLLVKLREKWS